MGTPVDVVIPTKSYVQGLLRLLGQLETDPAVSQIIVVADGPDAYNLMDSQQLPSKVTLTSVALGAGIHVMWNLGKDMVEHKSTHVAFINDDVSVGENCMSIMAEVLDRRPEIGLLTPNFTGHALEEFSETQGFAGFCMMLAQDLVHDFRFDERMMWWYGDNDIIMWVNRIANRKTGITGLTTCAENQSYTITNDPPKDFHMHINNDARIYKEKWGL